MAKSALDLILDAETEEALRKKLNTLQKGDWVKLREIAAEFGYENIDPEQMHYAAASDKV